MNHDNLPVAAALFALVAVFVVAVFGLRECGAWIDSHMLWGPKYPDGESVWVKDCKLNYCPNCGARIRHD